MEILKGYFKSNERTLKHDIVVEYHVDKPLLKKDTYRIEFICLKDVCNSWRRTKKQFDARYTEMKLEINKDNSSVPMDDPKGFENFLKENIQEYWNEAKESGSIKQNLTSLGTFDTLEEIAEIEGLNIIFETLGYTKNEDKVEYLKSITINAY